MQKFRRRFACKCISGCGLERPSEGRCTSVDVNLDVDQESGVDRRVDVDVSVDLDADVSAHA